MQTERPRAPIALTPMLSVVIGLSAAIVIGALAIIVVLRLPCGGRRRSRFKRKELSQGTTTGEGSPGPSDKSIGSRELDGNESDEKNPDIIPDTVDSDDQVSKEFKTKLVLLVHFIWMWLISRCYEHKYIRCISKVSVFRCMTFKYNCKVFECHLVTHTSAWWQV